MTPEMNVTRLALIDLVPDPENPRAHNEKNIQAISASLDEHGQVEPLIIQKGSMMVIGGNGRREAMMALGWDAADVVLLDLSDTQARRLSISLNRSGELAEWDLEILGKHLDDLSIEDDGFEPDYLGFSDEEYMNILASLEGLADEAGLDESLEEQAAPTTDGGQPLLSPGTQPGGLRSSHVRMIQLFYNEQTEPQVRVWCKRLSEVFKTDNLTDTIHMALKEAIINRGWDE